MRGHSWRTVSATLGLLLASVVPVSAATPAESPPAFEAINPAAADLDVAALDRLTRRASLAHSDALVVLKDGRLVGDWRFGKPARPIELGAATEAVVGLAVGRLADAGKLSLGDPLSKSFPQLSSDGRGAITVADLLSRSSGLSAGAEGSSSAKSVLDALLAVQASAPGVAFSALDPGVDLLSAVVQRASGEPLDTFAKDQIFGPLGVQSFAWRRDASGMTFATQGLALDALDLAKVGQLMLDRGMWKATRVLSSSWTAQVVGSGGSGSGVEPADAKTGAVSGLLWWRLPTDPRSGAAGFAALGEGGQYLVVLPAERIVAVRQIAIDSGSTPADGLDDFAALVFSLVPAHSGAGSSN